MIGPPPGSLLRIGESIVNCHKPLDTLQLVPINSILWVPLGQVLGKMVFVEKCSKPMGELQQNHGFLQLKICNFGGLPPYFWTSQHHGKLMAHGTSPLPSLLQLRQSSHDGPETFSAEVKVPQRGQFQGGIGTQQQQQRAPQRLLRMAMVYILWLWKIGPVDGATEKFVAARLCRKQSLGNELNLYGFIWVYVAWLFHPWPS